MATEKTSIGVKGLDDILFGGVPKGSVTIVEGTAGSGKTTLAFQFLHSGAVNDGEAGLYITFEELPAQLYTDMEQFGWDVRGLEDQDLLRVVSISPDVLMEQMTTPNGLIEQMVKEIDCKRVVIDSISLFNYGLSTAYEQRTVIYTLRNILKKLGITTFLIREHSLIHASEVPFEHFVVDGVIRLSDQTRLDCYRERVLEVLKMRGQKFLEGEHVYRIRDDGIYLIPAFRPVENGSNGNAEHCYSTLIPELDDMLNGGLRESHVYMFDTSSRADYRHILASIVTSQFLQGRNGIIFPTFGVTTLDAVFEKHGLNLQEMIDSQRVQFVEHYQCSRPERFETSVIDVSVVRNDDFERHVRQILAGRIKHSVQRGDSWFAYYDLNTIVSERGTEFTVQYFAAQAALAKSYGLTLIALCNFEEVGEALSSHLERNCDTVICTWVERSYQYLQVTKVQGGSNSELRIVEHVPAKPYFRLV